MNETGSAPVSSLEDESGGEQNRGQRDQCQQRAQAAGPQVNVWREGALVSRRAADPSEDARGPEAPGVVAAVAVPTEHGDVRTPLAPETLVGPVVDREPAA